MKINWKLRLKNPNFWVPLILFLFSTVASVAHVGKDDLTTWYGLTEVIKNILLNPSQLFAIGFAIYGYIVDMTTDGASDSDYAMTKETPSETPLVIDKYGDGQEFTERTGKK